MKDLSCVKDLRIDFRNRKVRLEIAVSHEVFLELVLEISAEITAINVKGHKGTLMPQDGGDTGARTADSDP